MTIRDGLARVCTVGLIVLMTAINLIGSKFVERFQTVIVIILVSTLVGLALILMPDVERDMIAPDTYPPTKDILSSVALTFFAFLGFSLVAFTGEDLENPKKNMPRAMLYSILIAIATYVAVAIAVLAHCHFPRFFSMEIPLWRRPLNRNSERRDTHWSPWRQCWAHRRR